MGATVWMGISLGCLLYSGNWRLVRPEGPAVQFRNVSHPVTFANCRPGPVQLRKLLQFPITSFWGLLFLFFVWKLWELNGGNLTFFIHFNTGKWWNSCRPRRLRWTMRCATLRVRSACSSRSWRTSSSSWPTKRKSVCIWCGWRSRGDTNWPPCRRKWRARKGAPDRHFWPKERNFQPLHWPSSDSPPGWMPCSVNCRVTTYRRKSRTPWSSGIDALPPTFQTFPSSWWTLLRRRLPIPPLTMRITRSTRRRKIISWLTSNGRMKTTTNPNSSIRLSEAPAFRLGAFFIHSLWNYFQEN